jgi:hypothetical protein
MAEAAAPDRIDEDIPNISLRYQRLLTHHAQAQNSLITCLNAKPKAV